MIQFANPVNQPFRLDPFPNNQQKRRWRGFLFARGRSGKQLFSKPVSAAQNGNVQSAELSSYTSSDKKQLYVEIIQNFRPAGRFQYFQKNLEKLTNDPIYFRVSVRISDSFSIRTISNGTSSSVLMSQEKTALVDQQNQEVLKKVAIKLVQPDEKRKNLFPGSKFIVQGIAL